MLVVGDDVMGGHRHRWHNIVTSRIPSTVDRNTYVPLKIFKHQVIEMVNATVLRVCMPGENSKVAMLK